jgi:hypothetical protein
MSEQLEIEKMMVEDKLKTTDWEATSDIVVEQIARHPYLQFCKENMSKKIDGNKCSTSTVTSTETGSCSSSSSALTKCEVSPVAGQQKESCSSGSCDLEQNKNPYVLNYYMHTTGRRSKKRHHQHHHS